MNFNSSSFINNMYLSQGEEIEVLMNTVRKEYSELQTTYENELNMIEVLSLR